MGSIFYWDLENLELLVWGGARIEFSLGCDRTEIPVRHLSKLFYSNVGCLEGRLHWRFKLGIINCIEALKLEDRIISFKGIRIDTDREFKDWASEHSDAQEIVWSWWYRREDWKEVASRAGGNEGNYNFQEELFDCVKCYCVTLKNWDIIAGSGS